MYFVIVSLDAGLARKIRQFEKIALQKKESVNRIKLYHALINPLSHELKTPIAAIIGAADNLESNNLKLTAENRKELLVRFLRQPRD
jgi:two-component system sensor histidine kinase KdpD